MLDDSESKRTQLQDMLMKASIKLQKDQEAFLTNDLIKENKQMHTEVEQLNKRIM